MTPDCCKNCPNLKEDGSCKGRVRGCARWRAWFRLEWSRIRRAAYNLKFEGRV